LLSLCKGQKYLFSFHVPSDLFTPDVNRSQ